MKIHCTVSPHGRDIDVINENLTLNARRCESYDYHSGNDRTRCRLRICNIKCYMPPHVYCVRTYIRRDIYRKIGVHAREISLLPAHHYHRYRWRAAAAPLRFVLYRSRIKIPNKGIGETEMDLQSVLRKVANFYNKIGYRRRSIAEFRSVSVHVLHDVERLKKARTSASKIAIRIRPVEKLASCISPRCTVNYVPHTVEFLAGYIERV